MPLRMLVGFKRVSLQAGDSTTVTILVRLSDLRRWDEQRTRYVVDPGPYEFAVGPSSDRVSSAKVWTIPAGN
jgi:beta-glucosidase